MPRSQTIQIFPMKYARLIFCLSLTACIFLMSVTERTIKTANEGFAFVELFTSEGCSSCPPADQLMDKIQKENGAHVYILVFHVDYWDRLGWKDSFSNPDYSKRQYQYASWLNGQSVYTPQVIVNGKTEFVGSDEAKLHKAIVSGLNAKPAGLLSLRMIQIANNQISLQYSVEHAPENSSVFFALVQKTATSHVERGENKGLTLTHVQIVRSLQRVSLNSNKSGAARLDFPADANRQQFEITGFVQNDQTGEILAVSRLSLSGH
jgi:hypothetical protein